MLQTGLQGFHGQAIAVPRRPRTGLTQCGSKRDSRASFVQRPDVYCSAWSSDKYASYTKSRPRRLPVTSRRIPASSSRPSAALTVGTLSASSPMCASP